MSTTKPNLYTVGGGPIDPEDCFEYEERQEVLRSMRRMDDEPQGCPQCEGEPALLGQLGNIIHLRCRNCGWDFTS